MVSSILTLGIYFCLRAARTGSFNSTHIEGIHRLTEIRSGKTVIVPRVILCCNPLSAHRMIYDLVDTYANMSFFFMFTPKRHHHKAVFAAEKWKRIKTVTWTFSTIISKHLGENDSEKIYKFILVVVKLESI